MTVQFICPLRGGDKWCIAGPCADMPDMHGVTVVTGACCCAAGSLQAPNHSGLAGHSVYTPLFETGSTRDTQQINCRTPSFEVAEHTYLACRISYLDYEAKLLSPDTALKRTIY